MEKLKIPYWKVAIVGIISFLLSLLWYRPIIFGSVWEKYRSAPNPAVPQWTMAFAPLREIIAASIVALLVNKLGYTRWQPTLGLMFLLWFAFHAVGMAGAVLWDNMPWQLGAVHAGDWLMKLAFMGTALTLWQNKAQVSQVHGQQ